METLIVPLIALYFTVSFIIGLIGSKEVPAKVSFPAFFIIVQIGAIIWPWYFVKWLMKFFYNTICEVVNYYKGK